MKTGQSRTVRLLRPLSADPLRWRLASGLPADEALVFPNTRGGVWNDHAWQTWHRDVCRMCPLCVRLTPPKKPQSQKPPANPQSPYDLPKISFMISSVPPPMGPSRASRATRSISYSFM
jgi:hypothetical protein